MQLTRPIGYDKMVTAYEAAVVEAGSFNLAIDVDHLMKQRSGRMSWVYVDQSRVLCQPATLRPTLMMIGAFLEANFSPAETILINADSKFSPHITGALAAQTGYRQILVNPDATTQAENGVKLRLRIPAEVNKTDQFVIVDDTVTSGRTVIEVVEMVKRELGPGFSEAKFYLLGCLLRGRLADTQAALAAAGIHLYCFTDFASLAEKIPNLSAEQRAGIRAEVGPLQE